MLYIIEQLIHYNSHDEMKTSLLRQCWELHGPLHLLSCTLCSKLVYYICWSVYIPVYIQLKFQNWILLICFVNVCSILLINNMSCYSKQIFNNNRSLYRFENTSSYWILIGKLNLLSTILLLYMIRETNTPYTSTNT